MKPTIEELQKHLDDAKMRIAEIENGLNRMKAEPEKKKYPMQLIGIGSTNPLHKFEFGEGLKKYILFAQLVETCKEWNRIDRFEPEYDDQRTTIKSFSGTVFISTGILNGAIMLIDYTTAQLFLDTFRNELEQVKDLI